MDKLADLDTSFLVPCAHCDALLQEGERFCPSCGEDQLFVVADALAPLRTGTATGLLHAPAAGPGVGWPQPRADAMPGGGLDLTASPHAVRSARRRMPAIGVLGIVAGLVMIAFAAMWGIDQDGGKSDQAGRQRTFEATVARLRVALDRDDLPAAERALSTLDAAQVGEPDVLALRQDLERRVLAQARRREQLSSAAQSASRSLGFGAVSTAGAATATAAAPPPPSPPSPPRNDCNDALVALALCKPQ